jgi:fatty acid-binding protein DegV
VNRVAICTDSSSLLAETVAASLGVEVVPVPVTLDDEPFDERVSSLDWFYERMRAGAPATTSQPSPDAFADAYARAASRGARSVLSIHLDSRISGIAASAELAAREAPVPVRVVDTRTVSYGVALCVRAAVEAAAAGGLAADAALAALRLGGAIENAFVALDSPGGRVPAVASWTVFRFAHGGSERLFDCTSLTEVEGRLAELALDTDEPLLAAVGHAGRSVEATADQLAHRLARSDHVVGVERYRVGASVGAHTGPDSFGLFWWPAAAG